MKPTATSTVIPKSAAHRERATIPVCLRRLSSALRVSAFFRHLLSLSLRNVVMQHVLNHDGRITQSVQLRMNADKAIDETDGPLDIQWVGISLQQTDYHGDDSILNLVFSMLRNKHNHLFLFANSFFFSFPSISCCDLFKGTSAAPYYRVRQLTNAAAFTCELLLISQTMCGLMGRGLKRGHSRFLLFLQDTS